MKSTKSTSRSKAQLLSDNNSLMRFQRIFTNQWKKLNYWKNKAVKHSSDDDIHYLRIALRRFRLSLKLYEYFTGKKAKRKLKASLRKLTKNLGSLRNIDEAFHYFQAHDYFSFRHAVYKDLSNMRSLQVKLMKTMLQEFDHHFDNLVKEMATSLKSLQFAEKDYLLLSAHVSSISSEFSKNIHAHLDIATNSKKRKSRHALRIAIRKWRYSLELFASVLNRDYDSLLKAMKKYQTLLGQINDISSFIKLCRCTSLTKYEIKCIDKELQADEKVLLKKLSKLVNKTHL